MAPMIIMVMKSRMYFLLNMPESMMSSGGLIAVAVIMKAMTAPLLTPLALRLSTMGIMGMMLT